MLFFPRKHFLLSSVLIKKKKPDGNETQRLWRQVKTEALLIWKVLLLSVNEQWIWQQVLLASWTLDVVLFWGTWIKLITVFFSSQLKRAESTQVKRLNYEWCQGVKTSRGGLCSLLWWGFFFSLFLSTSLLEYFHELNHVMVLCCLRQKCQMFLSRLLKWHGWQKKLTGNLWGEHNSLSHGVPWRIKVPSYWYVSPFRFFFFFWMWLLLKSPLKQNPTQLWQQYLWRTAIKRRDSFSSDSKGHCYFTAKKLKGYVRQFCELKKMYTYNNMLYNVIIKHIFQTLIIFVLFKLVLHIKS